MLKNYFKLAIKVLGRRKFFTFISLFGISFTLMILMIAASFFESELGTNPPMTQKDNMIFLTGVSLSKEFKDTIMTIDTSILDNTPQYDTTYSYKSKGTSISQSSPSYYFLDTYFRDIPFTKKVSMYSTDNTFDIFINSKKLTFGAIYADDEYWNVFDFKFLQGQPFKSSQVNNQEQVVIISKQASLDYFGSAGKEVLSREIILDGKHFNVIGIIEPGVASVSQINADVYLPLTHLPPKDLSNTGFLGGLEAVFLAANPSDARKIKNEINQKETKISIPQKYDYDKLVIYEMTFMENYASGIISSNEHEENLKTLFQILSFFLLLFFLLPTLNLVNLNISRIMERSSEIGVRKAFGAKSSTILLQFVFENIILTIVGGIIGFVLALIVIYLINESQILENTILTFNYRVFIYSLLICLFFGILSGIIPAWRMSKVHIVNALKQNQL